MCLLPSCHIFNFVVRHIYLWKVTILLLGTQNLVHWSRIKLNNYNLLSESFHDLNWSATRIYKLQLNLSIFYAWAEKATAGVKRQRNRSGTQRAEHKVTAIL